VGYNFNSSLSPSCRLEWGASSGARLLMESHSSSSLLKPFCALRTSAPMRRSARNYTRRLKKRVGIIRFLGVMTTPWTRMLNSSDPLPLGSSSPSTPSSMRIVGNPPLRYPSPALRFRPPRSFGVAPLLLPGRTSVQMHLTISTIHIQYVSPDTPSVLRFAFCSCMCSARRLASVYYFGWILVAF
jgi:hypothetical protein